MHGSPAAYDRAHGDPVRAAGDPAEPSGAAHAVFSGEWMHVFDKGAEGERGPTAASARDEDAAAPGSPVPPSPERLAGVLGMLGLAEPTLSGVLEHLVGRAGDLVPQADGVVLVVARPDGGREQAVVGPGADAVERLQRDLAEGPAPDAVTSGRVLLSADLAAEPRWPGLAARVGATGVRSALCVPLGVPGEVLGHVGVYAAGPAAFGDRERHLAARWAATAARACAEALGADEERRAGRARLAGDDRAALDRAVAVLADGQGVGPEEALAVLALMARTEQRDLAAVARAVVDAPADDAGPGGAGG